jgi:hypothetical protein
MVCLIDKNSFLTKKLGCTCTIIHLAIVISSILSQMKSTIYCTWYWITNGCDLCPSDSCGIQMSKAIGQTIKVTSTV